MVKKVLLDKENLIFLRKMMIFDNFNKKEIVVEDD